MECTVAENILDRIVRTKRKELARRQAACPLDRLQAQAAEAPRARNFFAACTRRPRGLVNVIAEVKKASPSAGVIREDFDPAGIARQYEAAGAVAVSVLTDEEYFQGSLDYLRQVRQAVSLPVLRKDFIIDAYQVYEARAAWADAILLIAECLPPGQLMDLMILAASLRLTCLVEVHGMDSLMQVRSMIGFPHGAYSLLGINNRDLTTFKVDLANTLRLAEMVEDRRTLVSESGIRTRDDVKRLRGAGVNSVLIGETLMRADDIGEKFNELFAFGAGS
ncbi:MAG: indole-3-glycerol phosphate synthase TrpC [Planctomycetota bacterium]